jgi:hypothetical protein
MPSSTTSIISGFDYQARHFWLLACRLFFAHTKVVRIGYELDDVRGFDDIVLYYAGAIPSERGDPIVADHYQVKFHVDYGGAITWQSLMDPRFIGASSRSLLQKLQGAVAMADSEGRRFIVLSPWQIHPDDSLAKLISGNGGEVRLDKLMSAPAGSEIGRVREEWRTHLSLNDDGAFGRVLGPLRIEVRPQNLRAVNDELNMHLRQAGLAPVSAELDYHAYDDLIWKLRRQGLVLLDRHQLQAVCERNGLWQGLPTTEADAVPLGIRSFMRWAEGMEHQTKAMLCQVRHFDGRHIRDSGLWQAAVYPEVAEFLSRVVGPGGRYCLHLDTHCSVAFGAGYCLDTKCGAEVRPVQRTSQGMASWRPQPTGAVDRVTGWEHQNVLYNSSGHEVALALSVTHPVVQDVRKYIAAALPDVRRVLCCTPVGGPSNAAVRDGTHAAALARKLSVLLKEGRSEDERRAILHIFAAAPNGLMFLIGQLARSFGPCVLYEYDFDTSRPGSYQPSLRFPPPRAPGS